MIPRRIAHATVVLGPPENWDIATDGPCLRLPVRVLSAPGQEVHASETAWEPTPAELAALNAGASVILCVRGWQVPVRLYVAHQDGKAIDE